MVGNFFKFPHYFSFLSQYNLEKRNPIFSNPFHLSLTLSDHLLLPKVIFNRNLSQPLTLLHSVSLTLCCSYASLTFPSSKYFPDKDFKGLTYEYRHQRDLKDLLQKLHPRPRLVQQRMMLAPIGVPVVVMKFVALLLMVGVGYLYFELYM
ncbi:uncharacterized protein LOC133832823 [Humulus lupulus]|uniref:uncharacterized protein LOC133832823 n=1 Tax=Humulus lupulus TaxID=3486 RepID=UPI002B406C43|nr:uncharacterized protein LOC133832823 [Humulus lupulus]